MTASQVHVLANGLRVVHEQRAGGLASVHLWFEAGTRDERAGEHGAAHLLEHMLFKGTPTLGLGEAAARVEDLGGELNAYTTWDQTVLHATTRADGWRVVLGVLADMAWNSTLTPSDLAAEIPVVLEEIRGYDNDPGTVLEDAAVAALFPDHPYGRPILGTEASVSALDAATLRAFHRRHYGTGRCVLAVVGPMPLDEVLAAAVALPAVACASRPTLPPLPPARSGLIHVDGDFDTPMVDIAFAVTGENHPDQAALTVLASALGGGVASVLGAALRDRGDWVVDSWATYLPRLHAGSLELCFVPIDAAGRDAALAWTLARCATPEAIDDSAIERGRATVLHQLDYEAESVEASCHELAASTAYAGAPAARDRWREHLERLRPPDVREVAKRALGRATVLVLDPAPPTQMPSPRRAGAQPRVLRRPPTEGPDDSGPIASVHLAWPGGDLTEDKGSTGRVDAWASLVATGAGPLGEVALDGELTRLGAVLRPVGGRFSFGINLTAPAQTMPSALEILRLTLTEPRFDASAWERLQREALFELDTLEDRPAELLGRRLWTLMFPGHPWGRHATRRQIQRTRAEDIAALHRRWLGLADMKVGVAGPVSDEALAPLLAAAAEALPARAPRLASQVPTAPEPGHFHSVGGADQALVTVATRLPGANDPRMPALRAAVALLNAQSGPLFLALRERLSLAYTLWTRAFEGPDVGMLVIGLATDPGRRLATRRALLDELQRLVDRPLPGDVVSRAASLVVAQADHADQFATSRATHYAMAAILGQDPRRSVAREATLAVDPAQLRDALASLAPWTTLTLRPRDDDR